MGICGLSYPWHYFRVYVRSSFDGGLMMKITEYGIRKVLIDTYLDYRNNYLTIEKFADHNGMTDSHAKALIDLGREIFNTPNIHE